MENKIMSIDTMSVQLTQLLLPFIGALLIAIIALMLKDFALKIARGWAFKANRSFNEGDNVLLDGEKAIIVKVGLTESVFGIYSKHGYTWRYVPNERIQFLKLEKVINKDLHLDTDEEKGKKLQELIDKSQSDAIAKNASEILTIKKKV
jgi:hypothetical protein